MQPTADNYAASASTIKEPPRGILQSLKFLGPGFILSASVVGSGELIATTTLGARAGFTAFWVILVSCFVKVAIQLEFGKYAILTGESPMKSFNRIGGLRIGKVSWAVWTIFLLIIAKIVQLGGMLGATALVTNMMFPGIAVETWAVIIAMISFLLIFKGLYSIIEKGSLIMIAFFTIMTFASVFALAFTEFSISWADIREGFQLKLAPSVVLIAIGAFGITGVGSDEIIAYSYWCLEKGYASYTGPATYDAAWKRRASGWIKVMYLDAFVAMLIYTLVTAAFYLLGAAVLHELGLEPKGNSVIETLSVIYTRSLGAGIKYAYLVGAFFVLFSSVFATLAAWTRLYTDIFGQVGWIDFFNLPQRKKMISILSFVFPVIWLAIFLFIKLPVMMILFGGVVGSVMLLLVVIAAIVFYLKRRKIFPSGTVYAFAFWISILAILAVAVLGVTKLE